MAKTKTLRARRRAEEKAQTMTGTAPESVSKTEDAQEEAREERKTREAASASSRKREKAKAKAKEPKVETQMVRHAVLGEIMLPLNRKGRLVAKGMTCLCGCGEETVTPNAKFISGHDSKLRKFLLSPEVKGRIDLAVKLNPAVQTALLWMTEEPLAGVRVSGKHLIDMKAEDGEGDEAGDEE